MLLSRIFLLTSGLTLVALAMARIFWPAWVVGKDLGFILAFCASAAFFWGLAESRGLGVGSASIGRPLVLASVFFSTAGIDSLLGLNYLNAGEAPRMFVALSPLALFVAVTWWIVFRKAREEIIRLHRFFWLTFIVCAGSVVAAVSIWRRVGS